MAITIKKKKSKSMVFKGTGKVLIGMRGPDGEPGPLVAIGRVADLTISTPTYVVGIDVSTATGLVVLGWDEKHQAWRTVFDYELILPSLPNGATIDQRVCRLINLQDVIFDLLVKFPPAYAVIEGYSFGHVQAQTTMVELGAAVRMACMEWKRTGKDGKDLRLVEVAPTTLKKYVLGKGVGKKEQMILQVFKRWGYEAKTNNLADAYGLAQIGAALHITPSGATQPQIEVLSLLAAKIS